MTERETTRLVAWSNELRRAHARLREALALVRAGVRGTDPQQPTRDLLLHCRGFCTALDQHHRGEDRALFPAIEAAHPELAPVLRTLSEDHAMIDVLLTSLAAAVDGEVPPDDIDRHLDGIGAIMESHFAFEERQLLRVLETLALDADPREVLGRL
ncbi:MULTISPECIES: hemerythrin domain-containing protein [unclassified Microbacterium]|uniref:hemerythrin domain-containing protein n=1 Tax=unclassified Microbacterium TaxID=2609290 RepID=UPI00365093BE